MMKTIVRLSVLALAFAGFTAPSLVSASQSGAKHIAIGQTTSITPAACPSPSTCHID